MSRAKSRLSISGDAIILDRSDLRNCCNSGRRSRQLHGPPHVVLLGESAMQSVQARAWSGCSPRCATRNGCREGDDRGTHPERVAGGRPAAEGHGVQGDIHASEPSIILLRCGMYGHHRDAIPIHPRVLQIPIEILAGAVVDHADHHEARIRHLGENFAPELAHARRDLHRLVERSERDVTVASDRRFTFAVDFDEGTITPLAVRKADQLLRVVAIGESGRIACDCRKCGIESGSGRSYSDSRPRLPGPAPGAARRSANSACPSGRPDRRGCLSGRDGSGRRHRPADIRLAARQTSARLRSRSVYFVRGVPGGIAVDLDCRTVALFEHGHQEQRHHVDTENPPRRSRCEGADPDRGHFRRMRSARDRASSRRLP